MSRTEQAERPRARRAAKGGVARRAPSRSAPPASPPEPARERRVPIALVIAVVLAVVLEVLDITIVNVATAHMMGAFGATPDQITWVLTSYMVSAAVVMPLTGYLSELLGRRRLLTGSIIGFVISSALCGLAWDLNSMVVFRIAQGLCGAPLVPLSQGILLDAFPRARHGQALAIFGLGIMVAPVLGPTLGGWLTDTFSWRAVFYINVPIGVLALLLALGQLPSSPIKRIRTDWSGMALLVLAVGCIQLVLDQGPTHDWFDSRVILAGTVLATFTTVAFFMRGWNKSDNIVNLSLLKDRNFLAGTLAITAYGTSLFGSIALLPLLSQRLLGYPAMEAGLVFVPRAAASAVTMIITGLIVRRIDPRILIALGVIFSAVGTMMMAGYTLQVDYWGLAWPGVIAGIGMGFFFVPLTAVAFAEIPKGHMDEAAGLYALMRGIGSSLGIAIVSWLFVEQGQVHWATLIEHINPFNANLQAALAQHGIAPGDTGGAAKFAYEIGRQAQILAFIDLFWFIGWLTLAILPLIFMMKRPKHAELVMAH